MAFKQSNNPISRKTSPLRAGTFSMKDLEAKAASEKTESQSQANKLPQIEKPSADYEMDTDMTYAGGERGADYDEEGTKDGMSRKASPLDAKTKYTLDGKPLTKDQTGYDPKQLISDQSMAADKKSKKEYAAEKKKKDQAKPKPKKESKPINERNQAILDARKAKKNN
jgi:hypothetical protein|tara:strand:+ start:486 stop:989 length:504 start_codon:yes stop_codon:yes gene_type:complete